VFTIPGCENSVEKDILQQWRKLQPWVILEVNKFCYSKIAAQQNYYMYYYTSTHSMKYRRALIANYVAVRAELEPVTFVVGPTSNRNTIKEPMTLRQWSNVFQKEKSSNTFYSAEKNDVGMPLGHVSLSDIAWI